MSYRQLLMVQQSHVHIHYHDTDALYMLTLAQRRKLQPYLRLQKKLRGQTPTFIIQIIHFSHIVDSDEEPILNTVLFQTSLDTKSIIKKTNPFGGWPRLFILCSFTTIKLPLSISDDVEPINKSNTRQCHCETIYTYNQ
jgi:hypothetical protein